VGSEVGGRNSGEGELGAQVERSYIEREKGVRTLPELFSQRGDFAYKVTTRKRNLLKSRSSGMEYFHQPEEEVEFSKNEEKGIL